jgi:dynein heavy chain, axonemal
MAPGRCLPGEQVGLGGSGRQSLTRLAAHIAGCQLCSVEVGKSYDVENWREDLRGLLRRTGGSGQRIVFLLADTQIKNDAFLEDISSLLNTGEVSKEA